MKMPSGASRLSLPGADSYTYLYRVSYLSLTEQIPTVSLPDYPFGLDYVLLIIHSLGIDLFTLLKWFGPLFSALITLTLYCAIKKIADKKTAFLFSLLTCGPLPFKILYLRSSLTRPEGICLFFTLLIIIIILDKQQTHIPQLVVFFGIITTLFQPLLGYLWSSLTILIFLLVRKRTSTFKFPLILMILLFMPCIYYAFSITRTASTGYLSYDVIPPLLLIDVLLPDLLIAIFGLLAIVILLVNIRQSKKNFR